MQKGTLVRLMNQEFAMVQNSSQVRDETVRDWERRLHWSASGHGWFAKTDEAYIFVSEQAYERCLRAYFESRGIEWKTWGELMQPVEKAWTHQCEEVQAFQADLDQWLNSNDPGVQVAP